MNTLNIKLLVLASAALLSFSSLFSPQVLAAQAQTADEIMKKVDQQVRRTWNTQVAMIKLTTCKYAVKKGRMRCVEKPRGVVFENILKREDRDKNNVKSLAIIQEPISDKGIGLLTYEYDERGKDSDNWIYFSEFGKVKRLISSDEGSGSFFGSEFSVDSTENPEARKLYNYSYKLLEETTFEKRPVWKIEFTLSAEKRRKTKYEKLVVWIDKEKYTAVKEDLYRNGKVLKQRVQRNIQHIDGVWVARNVTMNNFATKRVSRMVVTSTAYHMDIADAFLTQRALTDFAFRERNLGNLSIHLK
ncbi:MAG: outer membrane lipoprotein-sorting protein [Algicola sp.]|nr:outer membrane lipoprotein-sorting protein [Algicola sp.]